MQLLKILVAVDNGYKGTKVYYRINGKEYKFSFDSKYEEANDDLNGNNTWHFNYNDKDYLVGEGASISNLDYDKVNNELHKICTYAALSRISNFIGYDIDLVVGYPLTICSSEKNKFIDYLNPDGEVNTVFEGEDKKFKINNITVLPQCAGAIYASDNVKEYKGKLFGVLDIGSKTINGCILNNLNVERKSIFTEELGIHILYNNIKKEFAKQGVNLQDFQIPYVIKDGLQDVPDSKATVKKVFRKHFNDIKTVMIKNNWDIDHMDIMIIGGGRIVMADEIKGFKHLMDSPVDDPVYANVKGFWKVGAMLYGYPQDI
jgi:hypothetical protein